MAEKSNAKDKSPPLVDSNPNRKSSKKDEILVTQVPPENVTGKQPNLPNSAGSSPATNGKARTAPRKTVTQKGKTIPHKGVSNDVDGRINKLEKLLSVQTEQNKSFQDNILNAMNGLFQHMQLQVDDQNDHAATTSNAGKSSHPISDSEDESEVGIDPNTVTDNSGMAGTSNDAEAMDAEHAEATTDREKPDSIGFAAQLACDTTIGPKIREDVAISLQHALYYKSDEKKVEAMMDRHKCPTNCLAMQVPIVNMSLWTEIDSKSRSKDCRLQRVQKPLIKGLAALAKLPEEYKLNQDLQDGFLLLANANFELNALRRETLKEDLNPQFHHLCKAPIYDETKTEKFDKEHYGQIFGSDLSKKVSKLTEEKKATCGVVKSKMTAKKNLGRNRYNPYGNSYRQSFQAAAEVAGWNKGSFLDQKKKSSFQANFGKKKNGQRRAPPPRQPQQMVKKPDNK